MTQFIMDHGAAIVYAEMWIFLLVWISGGVLFCRKMLRDPEERFRRLFEAQQRAAEEDGLMTYASQEDPASADTKVEEVAPAQPQATIRLDPSVFKPKQQLTNF